MSAFANIKTYVVDGAQSFRVQQGILAAELQVFFSTKLEERQLVAGPDYALDVENGSLVVRLIKPLCGFVTLARVADPCMVLQKFGVGMLLEVNSWAERVASRMAYLEERLALAEARPIGAPECEPKALTLGRALRMPCAVDDLNAPDKGCFVLALKDGVPSFVDYRALAYSPQYGVEEPALITASEICNGIFDAPDCFIGGVAVIKYPIRPLPLHAYDFAAPGEPDWLRPSSFYPGNFTLICGVDHGDVSVVMPLDLENNERCC